MARRSKRRCVWAEGVGSAYLAYHDREWGVPVRDDLRLFEFLVLEGAQAGLSWSTVLDKRENYRRALYGFDPVKVARYGPRRLESWLADPGLIRNRLKLRSAVANARAFLAVQREHGSFAEYVWGFVGGAPKINRWCDPGQLPAETDESRAMSRDLKRRGFSFVGPTICYAFMQAVGMVNDHTIDCFRWRQLA